MRYKKITTTHKKNKHPYRQFNPHFLSKGVSKDQKAAMEKDNEHKQDD